MIQHYQSKRKQEVNKQMFVNFFVATNLKKCGRNLELIFHKLEMGANIAIH